MRLYVRRVALAIAVILGAAADTATAQTNCQNTGSFDKWMQAFRAEAAKAGIKPQVIASALDGVTFDPGIIARDRRQGFFSQSFLDFSDKLATRNRYDNARRQIEKHKAIFARAEKDYGVPPAVIAALWALESDFGSGMGNLPVLRSLVTLAYDCRRGEYFRGNLLDALRIIEKGDLTPPQMVGSWAGELGQTQFLPTYYHKYAIDYDGDGRRDLYRSIPDIIGSSANFVKELGWKRGEPWLEEVRVAPTVPWERAGLDSKLPRSQWAKFGVSLADGRPLPADDKPASLLLLMGRNGPAFLAYENFDVYIKWNQSLNYATTAAYLGTRVAGGPVMGRGAQPVTPLTAEQMKELQQLLARRGYEVGEPDGRLGLATRAAVKKAQLKFGLPADSYPSYEVLERLRASR
jgi:lytic murein transglycosylase